MTELTGDDAPCSQLCYCARPGLLAEIARLKELAYKQADEIEWLQDMKARLRGPSKEWCAEAAKREADCEVGAGGPEQSAIEPAPAGECPDCGTPYAMGAHTDDCPQS